MRSALDIDSDSFALAFASDMFAMAFVCSVIDLFDSFMKFSYAVCASSSAAMASSSVFFESAMISSIMMASGLT